MRRALWLGPVVLFALLAMACETSETPTSNNIVDRIPWTPPETALYRVLDDDDQEVGTLEMRIEAQGGDAVRLTQYFDFPEAGFVNEAVVIADAATLEPQSTAFRIEGPDGTLRCNASYSDAEVTVNRVGEDGERTDTLDVPVYAYDSWADLFTWQTLPLGPGFETRYTDILSCTLDRTQRLGMHLEVVGEEEVSVPAGTYQTWELEIKSGGHTQRAWFTQDERQLLVKYYNGRETFELTETPS